ncbi:hypothetical protein CQ10_19225 [Bradyrhizobium valentinum]|nr:hypothetical protein CQ10_19225 [Bradyrhizobium valentinum]
MKMDGAIPMTAKETSSEREKRELDRQLDEELEATFPASDPPKITRFAKSPGAADRTRKNAAPPKVRAKRLSIF